MTKVWRVPNTTGMTVEERFASLFAAYNDEASRDSVETLIGRNARLVFEGQGSIVVTTPSYDPRTVKVLKSLGARGRKIGPKKSKRFEWAIPLSQLEEFCAYLPGFMKIIDGFLQGVVNADHNEAVVQNGGVVEREYLCSEENAPVPGELYSKLQALNVCIRHEPTSLMEGCVMVVYRDATKEEAAFYKRTGGEMIRRPKKTVSNAYESAA